MVERTVNEIWSLGEKELISYTITSHLNTSLSLELYDNLPPNINDRKAQVKAKIKAKEVFKQNYIVQITERGLYNLEIMDVYFNTIFNLVKRKKTFYQKQEAKVYPSIVQLKKYSLNNIKQSALFYGVKKTRKIGHSYDFDHIKNYVLGDDLRTINWKATSRKAELMVNHYEDEKSQSVYCIIDKSRIMNMSFDNLSLLDYSINASLVISNSAYQYQDKAGLITFSNVLGTVIPANRKRNQMAVINESLYNQKHRDTEANYPLLYYAINNLSRKRSLLFLFTNFESYSSFQFQVNSILSLAKKHVLIVILFKNTEIEARFNKSNSQKGDIYTKAVVEKYHNEKLKIVKILQNMGVKVIYTHPKDLTINTINKYLEIKSQGMA